MKANLVNENIISPEQTKYSDKGEEKTVWLF